MYDIWHAVTPFYKVIYILQGYMIRNDPSENISSVCILFTMNWAN